jgi:hypothetical protein
MKRILVFLILFPLGKHSICQNQTTPKSIPTKSASFYNPFLNNKLVSGQWIGDVYTPSGSEVKLTNGTGTFSIFNSQKNEFNLKFKGNTVNGIWDGYIYYMEKSNKGSLFIEGNFKSGLPHGQVICRFNDGNYFAGTFQFGKAYERISFSRNDEAISTFCEGFDLMQYINKDTSQFRHCKREMALNDPLYGAAIMISNIAEVSDKHVSIEKFLECVKLNDVEIFIKNPDFALAGAEAIKKVIKNPLWKNHSLEEIQEELLQAIVELKYENLSRSIEFISFLACVIEESRKW